MTFGSRIFPRRSSPGEANPDSQTAPNKERRNVAFADGRSGSSTRPSPQTFEHGLQSQSTELSEPKQPETVLPEPSRREVSEEAHLLAPALFDALKSGDVASVHQLIEEGADLWLQDTAPGSLNASVLHYAVMRGRTRLSDAPLFPEATALILVDMLLSAGAPVNAEDELGCTALHCAAALGMDEVVAELLSRGAFMDIQDKQIKYTPMHAAAAAGKVGCIILMIEAGAMVDEQVARIINQRLWREEALQQGEKASWSIGTGTGSDALGSHHGLAPLVNGSSRDAAASAEVQVTRSALSMLQKGRNDTVLPNGGGRLWALKDVTGMSIWDVLDSPSTACGVLDVLLQDLAHVDLMGPRSLVQLLQQTQSLRFIVNVAHKIVGAEAARVGMPADEVASQLDAAKNYLTRGQLGFHHQSMRTPQRHRLPLPVMRPALLSPHKEKERRRSMVLGSGGPHLQPHRDRVHMDRSSSHRKIKLIKAGSYVKRSSRHSAALLMTRTDTNGTADERPSKVPNSSSRFASKPSENGEPMQAGPSPPGHKKLNKLNDRAGQDRRSPATLDGKADGAEAGVGKGGEAERSSLPARSLSGHLSNFVQRLSGGLMSQTSTGSSTGASAPSPFSQATPASLASFKGAAATAHALHPHAEQERRSRNASLIVLGRITGSGSQGSASQGLTEEAGPVAEAWEGETNSDGDSVWSEEESEDEEEDMEEGSTDEEEGQGEDWHGSGIEAGCGQPRPLAVWDPGKPILAVRGAPGAVCEASEPVELNGAPSEGRIAMAAAAAAARAFPADSDDSPAPNPAPRSLAWSTADPAIAPSRRIPPTLAITDGPVDPPPPSATDSPHLSTAVSSPKPRSRVAAASTRGSGVILSEQDGPDHARDALSRSYQSVRARLPSKGAVGQSQEELKPSKPAPPGFKVWTLTLEQRLDECMRCIQWQTLKLEQYVEALLHLARDAPVIHADDDDDDFNPQSPKRGKKGKKGSKGARGAGKLFLGSNGMRGGAEQLLEDGEDQAGVALAWEIIRMAIAVGDRVLTHMLVDRLVCMFPRALLRCPWSTVMVDMCQVYPEVFHHLLCCLKDVSDDVRSAFVTSFNLEDLERKMKAQRAPPPAHQHSGGQSAFHSHGSALQPKPSTPPNQETRDSMGLGMVAARTASTTSSHPLSGINMDRRRAPSFSVFGNRMGSLWDKGAGQLDRYNAVSEDAASFKYTLYRHLVAGLTGVDYMLMKCFVEKLDKGVLREMAQMSVYKDFVALLPSKLVTRQGGGPDVIVEELAGETDGAQAGSSRDARAAANAAQAGDASARDAGFSSGQLYPGGTGPSGGSGVPGGSGARMAKARMVARRHLRGSLGKSTLNGGGPAINETKAEVLNVEGLLTAALAARSAESVQAGVESLVAWVEMNARNKRLCFIDGLSTSLVSEMAAHFPSAAVALFNISPQASRDIKVSSWLLGKLPVSYQCSNTRYSFMWRQAELQELDNRGYQLWQVEQLADQNMRFAYICRAAQQGCSVDDILELMDLGLMGHNIADLVSSGAKIDDVKDMLERGMPAELLSSMLSKKLSWQLVEVLLNHRVTRTTVEDRTLRMDLLQFDAESATTRGHQTFSHAFVTRFLEKWAAANWEKSFLDKVFHSSDTLCTKLKTAYDYKLSMRSNYLNSRASTTKKTSVLDWPRLLCIMSAFMQPVWVPSRWFTTFVFLIVLVCIELSGAAGHVLAPLTVHEQTVDATAKVLPIINAALLGDKSLLAGLMNADVPSGWYGTPVARAVIAVQWNGFAQVLMAMHMLEHILLMCMYGVFLLLVHMSLTAQQAELFFDASSRTDPDAIQAAQIAYEAELAASTCPNDDPSIMDNYAYGDLEVNRMDMFSSFQSVACIVCLTVYSLCNLWTRVLQIQRAGFRLWSSHLANHLDVLCSFFALCTIIDFLIEDVYSHVLSLGAIGALVMFVRLTLFSSIVERMGSLVRVVTEIMKDLRYFFILIAIIFGGFAIAFAVQLGGENSYSDVALQLFSTMTGDFTSDMMQSVLMKEGNWLMPKLALALWIIYGFMVGIVFVALLISIMNDTYDRIKDAEEMEVLRNKARIIVDLQTLLPPSAMQALQDSSLGPFLHTLMPSQDDSQAPTLAKVDEWQGRMQQIRNAVRLELVQHLKPNAHKNQPNMLITQDIQRELQELNNALKSVKSEMSHLSKAVVTLQATNTRAAGGVMATSGGGATDRPGILPTAAGVGMGAGEQLGHPTTPPLHKHTAPTIDELVNSASNVLGNANLSLLVNTAETVLSQLQQQQTQAGKLGARPAAALGIAGNEGPSPAVAAALEGRTMLKMVSLPGRYFAREIPSTRGKPTAARQTVWKIASKLAAESKHTELHPEHASTRTSITGSRPSTTGCASSSSTVAPAANGTAGSVDAKPNGLMRMLLGTQGGGVGGAAGGRAPVDVPGTGMGTGGGKQPAGASGLLTRFAVHTMTNLANSGAHSGVRSLAQSARQSGAQQGGGAQHAEGGDHADAVLPGQTPPERSSNAAKVKGSSKSNVRPPAALDHQP